MGSIPFDRQRVGGGKTPLTLGRLATVRTVPDQIPIPRICDATTWSQMGAPFHFFRHSAEKVSRFSRCSLRRSSCSAALPVSLLDCNLMTLQWRSAWQPACHNTKRECYQLRLPSRDEAQEEWRCFNRVRIVSLPLTGVNCAGFSPLIILILENGLKFNKN
jgi:hypothetical protein